MHENEREREEKKRTVFFNNDYFLLFNFIFIKRLKHNRNIHFILFMPKSNTKENIGNATQNISCLNMKDKCLILD